MIVGDDTRTRVRAGRSEPRHPRAAPALARPREDPGARTEKRRSEKGLEQAAPRHATAPINAGRGPNAPNDAPRASPRLDHPDAPARRRGRPWPLEHASAVLTDRRPPGLGRGPQLAAEAHTTSTRRANGQKPCSGQNTGRESPTITLGAPEKLKNLARDGFIQIGDTDRTGTLYAVALPSEVPAVQAHIDASRPLDAPQDHYRDPVLRKRLFERDGWHCRYCGELVTTDGRK
jgi:hypothetical protein